jgi:hypothetical protein
MVVGTVTGGELLAPLSVFADEGPGVPRPIPGVTPIPIVPNYPFHVFFIPDKETATFDDLLTITDFNGLIAAAHISGTGVGRTGKGAPETDLTFDVDNRFFVGEFVATDGRKHKGTFAFV